MPQLIANTYGKGAVRLTKVVRNLAVHRLFEFSITILLEGDFTATYTTGDNASCIPTDTMKNTVYALAKQHDFDSPEAFGKILTAHFLASFDHVSAATADIAMVLWDRIPVAGHPHDHAFQKASNAVRVTTVSAKRSDGGIAVRISSGIQDLEVIKTTKSAFTDYIVDRYTTLQPTTDRIFGTTVEAVWSFGSPDADFNATFGTACRLILETFATHDSLGVQHTIFAMGKAVLGALPEVREISFTLPNQHRILANLAPFKLENPNEIFVATSEPYGLIKGTIGR